MLVKMEDGFGNFHLAIKRNDADGVRECLEKGGMSPDWDFNGRPAILEATYHGCVDVVRLLVDAGADPNAQNTLGEAALHHAFHPKTFSGEIVRMLLEKGGDVNLRETLNGHTPMHAAAKLAASGKVRQPDVLMDAMLAMCGSGVDVTRCDRRGETALHRLVSGTADPGDAARALVADGGYDPNAQNARGETPLMLAVDAGHDVAAAVLLAAGACANRKDRHFQTALHRAAQQDAPATAAALLAEGADAGAADLNGDTPLHIAASKGLAEVVRVLLAAPGVDVSAQNLRGATPLLCAVESGFTRVVQLLLEAHCDADCEKALLKALDLAEDTFVRRWHPEIYPILQEALVQKRDLWDEGETSL